jgi:hypothetical protein
MDSRFLEFARGGKAHLVAFILVILSSTAPARAYWVPFDGGGRVGDYLDLVASANATGAKVEIAGICASACTLKLGARNACVHPDAHLWFHAARNRDGRINALANMIMMQRYPARVRQWALAVGALNSTSFTAMSGAQAIALGVVNCDRATSGARSDLAAPAARPRSQDLPAGRF